jgi:hypothetical protein
LKLQVKGTQKGGWGLFQSHLKNADYHGAVDAWLSAQQSDIVYVFVQFRGISVGAAPRCYLARPAEIVRHMRGTRGGCGLTALREKHLYRRGAGAGHTDEIPKSWLASQARIDSV